MLNRSSLFAFVGGTKNSSFNGRTVSWQKSKRIKARVAKKRAGTKEKHVATALKGVSGARTKKHQRKAARRDRLTAKETEALDSVMDVDAQNTSSSKIKKKTGGKTAAPMQE